MQCPRLDHFVRFNANGTVSRCGHMVNPPEFASLEHMENSVWLHQVRAQMSQDQWPPECLRCSQSEQLQEKSIRQHAIDFDQQQTQSDYLMVGGTLDNICNSACQFCNENISTKIGSLRGRDYPRVNNIDAFYQLPQQRIVHLDLNGGEPTASPNYKRVLANLSESVKSVRVNTNCSIIMPELAALVERGVDVTVTVSFDGVGAVHDYVRWPIEWQQFERNLMIYRDMNIKLNLWTTVCCLNVGNMPAILNYVQQHGFDHSWALLNHPHELDCGFANSFTLGAKIILEQSANPACQQLANFVAVKNNNQVHLDAYIRRQDLLRGIDYRDYYDTVDAV